MKSKTPTELHELCGKSMLDWVCGALEEAGVDNICKELCGLDCVDGPTAVYSPRLQKENLKDADNIITIYANMPLVDPDIICEATAFHKKSKNACTAVVCDGEDVGIYIYRTEDVISAESDNIFEIFEEMKACSAEYDVQDAIRPFMVEDRVDLAEAGEVLRSLICLKHMYNGVTIVSPGVTYIDADVEIGQDTVIHPNVCLKGNTRIGSDVTVGANTTISDSIISDGVDILNSVITESYVESGAHIGPFAYIRPNSKIGKNVKIGDFVEIKNATLDEGTKVSHLTYVGDTDVGKRVNFGCGCVTVNYDGKKKYRSKIGDDAFVGCNTNLVSPVIVDDGAYIAAGSTITDDVPKAALAIARARQIIKTNWKDRRSEEK